MHVDSRGQLVIDDAYVCQFMSRHGNESFFATCESILKSICLACEHNLSQDSQNDIITQRLNVFKGELLESISSRKVDTSEIMSTIKTMNEHNILNITSKLEQIPHISGKIDELKNKMKDIFDWQRSLRIAGLAAATQRFEAENGRPPTPAEERNLRGAIPRIQIGRAHV